MTTRKQKQTVIKAAYAGATSTAPIPELKPANVADTLAERGNKYGKFRFHATTAQGLKERMRGTTGWYGLPLPHREALDMIQHKIARILNGDPNYIDNWHDIQGYAKLVEDILIEDQQGEADHG
jgi:hypothetical protein